MRTGSEPGVRDGVWREGSGGGATHSLQGHPRLLKGERARGAPIAELSLNLQLVRTETDTNAQTIDHLLHERRINKPAMPQMLTHRRECEVLRHSSLHLPSFCYQ